MAPPVIPPPNSSPRLPPDSSFAFFFVLDRYLNVPGAPTRHRYPSFTPSSSSSFVAAPAKFILVRRSRVASYEISGRYTARGRGQNCEKPATNLCPFTGLYRRWKSSNELRADLFRGFLSRPLKSNCGIAAGLQRHLFYSIARCTTPTKL